MVNEVFTIQDTVDNWERELTRIREKNERGFTNMETVKGIIKVLKKNKKGFQLDNEQWYSNDYLPELLARKGDEVEVKYKVNNGYNNYEEVKVLSKATPQEGGKVNLPRETTMYTSYAKDIFVAMMPHASEGTSTVDVMAEAINLVNQARNAFE